MKVPSITTTTIASAATTGASYIYDLRGVDRASLQLNGTLGNTDTSVITLTISNDKVNFSGFSTAKTVTLTGGGTTSALFELGSIDYAFLKVTYGTPSAGTITLVGVLYATATLTQGA